MISVLVIVSRELTDNDMSRIGTLMEENLYNEVLKYMKENNLKLEQEIVSYYLVKDINYTIPPLYLFDLIFEKEKVSDEKKNK